MKLKKSVLLSIAILGSSASIFSYATVYNVEGSDANVRGERFKSLLSTVSSGDEIIISNEVRLTQGEGKLDIPGVTIRSDNNSTLHIEGSQLNLTGKATFDNLRLSLRPARTLKESFTAIGGQAVSTNAKPTLIVTNGFGLALNKVTTKVEGENDSTRPIIVLGGGNNLSPETLTITGSTLESKFYGIAVDNKKVLNSDGSLGSNSNPVEKNITIDIGPDTNVLGGISLSGAHNISIDSKSFNVSKIDTGDSSNVSLSIAPTSSYGDRTLLGRDGTLETNKGARFKNLNLEHADITLKNSVTINTLELKNGGIFNVGNRFSDDDNLTVTVDNLKSEGENTLILDSGKLEIKSAEIKSGALGARGDLTFPDGIDRDDDGNYVPSKEEETLPQPPEFPSTQPDSNDEEAENSNSGTQPENQPSGPSNTENTGGDNSSTETNQPSETGTGESEGETETGETVGGEGEPPATNEDNSNVDNSKDEVDTISDKSEESADDPNASSPTPSTEPSETTEELTNTEDKPSSPTNEASNGTNPENSGKDEESSNEGSSTDNPQDSDKEQPESQPPVATEESTPITDNTVTPNAGTNEADTESAEKQNSTEDGKDKNSASEKDEQSGNDEQGKENQEQPDGVIDTNAETGKSDAEVTDTNSSDASNESKPDSSNTESPSVDGSENVTETPNSLSDTEDSNKEPEGSSTGNGGAANGETGSGNAETEHKTEENTNDGETSVGEQPKKDKVEEPAESQPEEAKQEGSEATEQPKDDTVEELAESKAEEPKKDDSEAAEQPKDDKVEGATESKAEEPKKEGSEATEQPKDDTVEEVTESKSEEHKKDDSEIAEKLKDDKAEAPTESQPEESKQEGSAVVENPTELSNPSVNNNEGKADEKTDKPEMPIEKTAEKSIKDRIMDTLKGWFTSNKVDEKQQQQVVEKTEESLKNLVEMYTDYDFSFSFDATRVAENRLNELAMLNGLESAANNYAFLAQSARALQNHNSVWVSSSLTEQRGDSKRRLNTINLGYDKHFDNLILGGFVSYLRQKGERGGLNSKLDGYAFSLYGKYNQNAHEVVALLNAGKTKADLQRNISALGIYNKADAKGKFVGVKVEYGYRMPFEAHNLLIKPLIALNYNLGRQAAFTERGTMPVHVDKIKAQRLAVEAGVELRKYFETAYVYVKPTIQTDVMARSNDVDIRFVDTPNSIPFKSVAKKKTYFALSLGTQLQLRKNLLLDLSANSRMGKHERDIQGNIRLNYKF